MLFHLIFLCQTLITCIFSLQKPSHLLSHAAIVIPFYFHSFFPRFLRSTLKLANPMHHHSLIHVAILPAHTLLSLYYRFCLSCSSLSTCAQSPLLSNLYALSSFLLPSSGLLPTPFSVSLIDLLFISASLHLHIQTIVCFDFSIMLRTYNFTFLFFLL